MCVPGRSWLLTGVLPLETQDFPLVATWAMRQAKMAGPIDPALALFLNNDLCEAFLRIHMDSGMACTLSLLSGIELRQLHADERMCACTRYWLDCARFTFVLKLLGCP